MHGPAYRLPGSARIIQILQNYIPVIPTGKFAYQSAPRHIAHFSGGHVKQEKAA
jgi:hypothetical protein